MDDTGGSCSFWCFEIQEISHNHLASHWEALLSTRGLKSYYYDFLKMGIRGNLRGNFLKGSSGLSCLSKYLKKCVRWSVHFSDVLYLLRLGLRTVISEKNLINFLLVFT